MNLKCLASVTGSRLAITQGTFYNVMAWWQVFAEIVLLFSVHCLYDTTPLLFYLNHTYNDTLSRYSEVTEVPEGSSGAVFDHLFLHCLN